MRNKSQSEVITTVLLILLVIVGITILSSAVISFIKPMLENKCFEVMDQVQISRSSQYTCYNSSSNESYVKVHIGDKRDKLDGFIIELGGASTQSIKVTEYDPPSNVRMYNGAMNLELPNKNEDRTYVIQGVTEKPDIIKLYPVLSDGKSCDPSDVLDVIDNCFV